MTTITLSNIHLDYPIYHAQAFSLKHSLVTAFTGGILRKEKKKSLMVSALKDISFSLTQGDRLGLIGHNGAGKTTLLKVLAGIFHPTQGRLRIEGKVSTLFNVQLGTYEEMTGYENLYLSSIIRGKSCSEAKRALASMGEFTGLGDYLYVPMHTYSAGMKMRVGFSVATEGNPDILLIDEIFGTGDKNFLSQSIERMTSFIDRSGILVFSSHSEDLLKKFCNKILILQQGAIEFFGNTEEALSFYKTK